MLMPSIFRENLFDDWFDFPDFRDLDRTERKLYGMYMSMKTTMKWISICLVLRKTSLQLN